MPENYEGMGPNLIINTEVDDQNRTVYHFVGDLDLRERPVIREKIQQVIDNKSTSTVIFDIAQLEFIDSIGLNVFLEAHRDLEAAGIIFKLRNLNPTLKRIFTVSGILDFFNYDEDSTSPD